MYMYVCIYIVGIIKLERISKPLCYTEKPIIE